MSSAPSSLITKTAWSSIASLSLTAASVVTVVLVARLLGVTGAGEVAYSVWISATVGQITLLALPQAALRFLASSDNAGVAHWLVVRSAALLLPGAVGAAALAHASGGATRGPAVVGLLAASSMAGAMGHALLAGRQEYRRLAVLSVASSVTQVLAVTTGSLLAGATGCLAGHAAGQIPLILGLRGHPATSAPPPPAVLRRIRSFALHTWLAAIAALVAWSRLEFAFLQARGPEAVGLYAIALTVSQLALQPSVFMGGALLPHFGELVGGAHTETSRATFAAVTRTLAFLSFPLCVGLAAIAPAFVPVVFGASFSGAAGTTSLLVAAAAVPALGPAVSALVYSHERNRYISSVSVASAILTGAGFYVLVPRFGIAGAAAVRSVMQIGEVVLGFAYVRNRLGAQIPIDKIARSLVAAMIGAAAGRVVVELAGHTWPSVLGAIVVVGVVYGLTAPRLRPLEASDAQHLEALFARLPGLLRTPAVRYVHSLASTLE